MSEPQARPSVVAGHEHPVDRARVEHARAPGLSAEDSSRLAGTLSLLADPIRARILYALDLVEESCVGDIALALNATVDPVGYGLRPLDTAGLVATRKEGRVVGYRPAPDFPQPMREHCLRRLVDLSRSGEDVEEGE
jgi:DNA-binding transcriptional ArsR family regulator